MKRALLILLAASVAGAALAQDIPESILPPGFGDPPRSGSPGTPDLSRIEDIIISESLDGEVVPVEVEPPVEYRDDRRRDPAMTGVVWPEAIGLSPQPWGSASAKFLSVVLRRTDGPLASRWAQIGLRNVLLAKTAAPRPGPSSG